MTVLAIAALKHHILMHMHTHTLWVHSYFHITSSIWLDVQQRFNNHDIYYCSVCLRAFPQPRSVKESRLSLDRMDHSLSPEAPGVPQ